MFGIVVLLGNVFLAKLLKTGDCLLVYKLSTAYFIVKKCHLPYAFCTYAAPDLHTPSHCRGPGPGTPASIVLVTSQVFSMEACAHRKLQKAFFKDGHLAVVGVCCFYCILLLLSLCLLQLCFGSYSDTHSQSGLSLFFYNHVDAFCLILRHFFAVMCMVRWSPLCLCDGDLFSSNTDKEPTLKMVHVLNNLKPVTS